MDVSCLLHVSLFGHARNALPLSYLSWAKDNCPVCRLRNQVTILAKGNSHCLRVMQSKHAKEVSHLLNFQGKTTFLPQLLCMFWTNNGSFIAPCNLFYCFLNFAYPHGTALVLGTLSWPGSSPNFHGNFVCSCMKFFRGQALT